MSSPFNGNNGNGFDKKSKNKKLNRTTVITVLTLAIAIVIVATAAIVSNRNKQTTPLPDISQTDKPTERPTEQEQPTEQPTEQEQPTERPSDTQTNSSPVAGKLPSFILPTAGVLSNKHNPDLQVFSPTMNDYRVHLGIDLVTKENAPVYAAADGKVSKIWVDPLMGYCIAISHAGNSVTIYKNLAEQLPDGIAEGASVRSGQLIATVGESAMVEIAEEPHLHFEMTVSDLSVDPLKYFDEAALESIKADTTHE